MMITRPLWTGGQNRSLGDVRVRAELLAYWTGGSLDEDGNLHLPDLTSKQLDKRAMAELILAVLGTRQEGRSQ